MVADLKKSGGGGLVKVIGLEWGFWDLHMKIVVIFALQTHWRAQFGKASFIHTDVSDSMYEGPLERPLREVIYSERYKRLRSVVQELVVSPFR